MTKPFRLGVDNDIYDALKIATLGATVSAEAAGGGVLNWGDGILLFDSAGAPVTVYPATQAGLLAALAAANSGDTVWLPSRAIVVTVGVALAAGVALIGIDENAALNFSGFSGTAITMADGAIVERFTLTFVSNGATAIGIDARFSSAIVSRMNISVSGGSDSNIAVRTGTTQTGGGGSSSFAFTTNVVDDNGAATAFVGDWGWSYAGGTGYTTHFGIWACALTGSPPGDGKLRVTVNITTLTHGVNNVMLNLRDSTIASAPSTITRTPTLATWSGGAPYGDPVSGLGSFVMTNDTSHPFPSGTSYMKIASRSDGDYTIAYTITSIEWVLDAGGVIQLYPAPVTALPAWIVYCRQLKADGTNAIGVRVAFDTILMYSRLSGVADLWVDAGIAFVYGNQYIVTYGTGTIQPLPGDRAAKDVDNWAMYHATDIAAGISVYHNPGNATLGQAPVWDGSKWVATDIVTQAEMHAPVTLGADAGVLLGLTGQLINLDLQAAHAVLIGPTSGDAAAPTVRALVAADLPDTAVTPASYGDATHVGQFTVDAQGRLTLAANVAISGAAGQYRQFVYEVSGGDFHFIIDGSGNPVTALQSLE